MALFKPIPPPKASLWTLPEESKRDKYDPVIPGALKVYLTVLFLLQTIAFLYQGELIRSKQVSHMSMPLFYRQTVFFAAASCMGKLFDGYTSRARRLNASRVYATPLFLLIFVPDDILLWYSAIIDLLLWIVVDMALLGKSTQSIQTKQALKNE